MPVDGWMFRERPRTFVARDEYAELARRNPDDVLSRQIDEDTPRPQGNKWRRWRGTCANLDAEQLREFWSFNAPEGPHPEKHKLLYIIVGTGESNGPGLRCDLKQIIDGTQEYQGTLPCDVEIYLELRSRVRATQMKEWFPYCEWKTHSWPADAGTSGCKKGGNFHEWGTLSVQRKRSNIAAGTRKFWDSSTKQIQTHRKWPQMLCDWTTAHVVSRCLKWARRTFEGRRRHIRSLGADVQGYKWQRRFEIFLTETKPDTKTVIFVVSPGGNIGASRFRIYMCATYDYMWAHPTNYVANATMWEGQKTVFFDLARLEKLRYRVVTQPKLGIMLQTKYQPAYKCFDSPHIVIFSKNEPHMEFFPKGSLHVIRNLGDTMTLDMLFPPRRFPQVVHLQDPFAGGSPRTTGSGSNGFNTSVLRAGDVSCWLSTCWQFNI